MRAFLESRSRLSPAQARDIILFLLHSFAVGPRNSRLSAAFVPMLHGCVTHIVRRYDAASINNLLVSRAVFLPASLPRRFRCLALGGEHEQFVCFVLEADRNYARLHYIRLLRKFIHPRESWTAAHIDFSLEK